MTLTRADLLVLWSRSVDHDGPDHPLTRRVREAYEAAPPEPPMHTDGDDTPNAVASTERDH